MLDVDRCVIKNEHGSVVARLHERGEKVFVEKMPACSIGMYFYVLNYLKELGFEVE